MKKKRINELHIVDKETQSEQENNRKIKHLSKSVLLCTLAACLVIALFAALNVYFSVSKFPDIADLPNTTDLTTRIYDVNNKLVANIHGDEDRVKVNLKNISPWLQRAVISIEDARFYEHGGLDLTGTIRAAYLNVLSGGKSIQGGSTLTQQLVKNTYLSPKRSIKRKLVEAIIAFKVENNFSKNEILEMYLNQIYWGNQSYGAEKAARRYFKKAAKDLSLAESSFLAGIIKAPEAYSPYRNYKHAKIRQRIVLDRMEHYGYITHDQSYKALRTPLYFYGAHQRTSKYPYFIQHVIYLLRKNYGDDILRRGGLRVYTTLDPQVQNIAEKVIEEGVSNFPEGTGASQGALVSIDVDNGYIQALVGGVDFDKSNYNRATQSKRAAGSSFKPIVYLTGFRLKKITPDTPITDAPISFNTGWNVWSPKNWDGKFMGRMNVRRALTLSRNTPTVRIGLKVGLDNIIKTARLVGIKGHIDRNLSIVLGSLGISPLEMATAFSTIAREGVYIEPIAIRKIENSQGKIIEINKPNKIQVIESKMVRYLNSILIDVVEKGTGRSAKLDDRIIAGKTGTSDDVRDIWFTGFTPDTVTTIWVGNDGNHPLKGLFSSNCAKLWKIFSTEYYKVKDIPPRVFNDKYVEVKLPKKVVKKKVEKKEEKVAEAKPDDKKDDNNKKEQNKKIPKTKKTLVNKKPPTVAKQTPVPKKRVYKNNTPAVKPKRAIAKPQRTLPSSGPKLRKRIKIGE